MTAVDDSNNDDAMRDRPNVQAAVPRLALVAAVCLFGAAALTWMFLPMHGDGGEGFVTASASGGGVYGYGSDQPDLWFDKRHSASKAAGGQAGGSGRDGTVQGTITARIDGYNGNGNGNGNGKDDMSATAEWSAREAYRNWMDGTITDDEYLAAMAYLYPYLDDEGAAAWLMDGKGVLDNPHRVWANASVYGPPGSAQGWCKPGLNAVSDPVTGEMVCLPYPWWYDMAIARGDVRYDGMDGYAGGGSNSGGGGGAVGGDRDKMQGKTWAGTDTGAGYMPPMDRTVAELKARIAELEEINTRLLVAIGWLQEEVEAARVADGAAGAGGSAGEGVEGAAVSSSYGDTATVGDTGYGVKSTEVATGAAALNLAKVAASGSSRDDGDTTNLGICLHGTDMTFTSVLDPQTLEDAGGELGTIPMPDGRYTVLLVSGSSTPVSVRVGLEGDGGLSYDTTFILSDTGRPPGEETTMWDYNSGVAEFEVDVEQAVNATAGVHGGDGLAAFLSLARCR